MSSTTAPSAAYASAIARPIPLLAPVTTACSPASRPDSVSGSAGYPSTPAANGWRAASEEPSTVLALSSSLSARAIDSFVAW